MNEARRLSRVVWWAVVAVLVLAAFLARSVSAWLPFAPSVALGVFLVVTARPRGSKNPA
jgi:hypothetical protein